MERWSQALASKEFETMKIKKTFVSVMVGLVLSQAVLAAGGTAEPSCAQVICLSPAKGTPAPQECFPIRAVYFSMVVYDPSFDAGATNDIRSAFLETCRTARPMDLMTISNKYGRLPADPIAY
jgi:hypothetical protein